MPWMEPFLREKRSETKTLLLVKLPVILLISFSLLKAPKSWTMTDHQSHHWFRFSIRISHLNHHSNKGPREKLQRRGLQKCKQRMRLFKNFFKGSKHKLLAKMAMQLVVHLKIRASKKLLWPRNAHFTGFKRENRLEIVFKTLLLKAKLYLIEC